ncbi:MAG: helix-turn-helix domain-containing protein [Bifidobacterium psychraerophilum]|uniref:winged helix-turn-helix transcriptional regulator n=1 Tax=Bifidobacterium psychraerophilum TaxID=218140 RepID=UPI0039E98C55
MTGLRGSATAETASLGAVRNQAPKEDASVGNAHTPVEACPSFVRAMAIIGRRWSGLIIQAMAKGCTSFTEISTFAEKLSDASLSRRLKELEDDGLIIRSVLDERPVKVRYSLTEAGVALAPALDMLTSWGEQYATAPEEG